MKFGEYITESSDDWVLVDTEKRTVLKRGKKKPKFTSSKGQELMTVAYAKKMGYKVNEMDDLDRLQMQMDAINKKLPMMKKMIEKNTSFKVKKIYQGGQESDPMIDLGDYDLQFIDQGNVSYPAGVHREQVVLKKNFRQVTTGSFVEILEYLKKIKK